MLWISGDANEIVIWCSSRGAVRVTVFSYLPVARGDQHVCNANIQPANCTHGDENTVAVYAQKNRTKRPQN